MGSTFLAIRLGKVRGVSASAERTSSEKSSDRKHILGDSLGYGERRLGKREADV